MILYLVEQGCTVGLKSERLEIRKQQEVLDSFRLDDLEQLVLFGYIQLTTQAIQALLKRDIDVCFLSRSGVFLGRLAGKMGKQIELRRKQFAGLEQSAFALDLARRCIVGKLANQRALLMRYQRKLTDPSIAQALLGIRLLVGQIDQAQDLDVLRGLEGKAAALYFGVLGRLISAPQVHFTTRIRRPPPDPVNILLSFGYTLLTKMVHGFVESAGMDPYLGALHAPRYGRPSLALDLVEEWRPVIVDTAVLRAINTKTISPQDFLPAPTSHDLWPEESIEEDEISLLEPPSSSLDPNPDAEDAASPPRPLLMQPEAVKRWFALYERRLQEETFYLPKQCRLSYRQIIREQAYLCARHLKGEAEYTSFLHEP
ncbi:CRISPR-associated endonuclease Cas1 [Myxococcota bacterium]|nr:CRISPR-associated endonuclease Cas1 [Myxococcota bacterium]